MNDNNPATRYHITVTEVRPVGATGERIDGVCDAFVIATTADPTVKYASSPTTTDPSTIGAPHSRA